MPIRDVLVRARFDLVATLLGFFLRRAASCLGNFVISAGLRLRKSRLLSFVAYPSRGLEL